MEKYFFEKIFAISDHQALVPVEISATEAPKWPKMTQNSRKKNMKNYDKTTNETKKQHLLLFFVGKSSKFLTPQIFGVAEISTPMGAFLKFWSAFSKILQNFV